MRNLNGKVALVTGGDSGIGLGIARALMRAGVKVAFTYRTRSHLRRALNSLQLYGADVHPVELDVTNRDAFKVVTEEVIGVFGKIHVLVNNAGVWPTIGLIDASYDDFDWCLNVNLIGVFNGIRTVLPHIQSHGEEGHIISTASVTGLAVGPLWGVYSTSKFAVVGMMEALRTELEGTRVGVSVFCPGGVVSEIGRSDRNRSTADRPGESRAEQKAALENYKKRLRQIIFKSSSAQPMMDAEVAGEIVVAGILNNDLYILSHPEYRYAIQERCEALLASIPVQHDLPLVRGEIAQIARTEIYRNDLLRRAYRHQQLVKSSSDYQGRS